MSSCENRNNKKKRLSMTTWVLAGVGLWAGGFLIGYGQYESIQNLTFEPNQVLKVSEFSEIEDKIKSNSQLSSINVYGAASTKIKDLVYVVADKTSFYYDKKTNTVINGVLFNAETGIDETKILKEIVLQNAKLRGVDVTADNKNNHKSTQDKPTERKQIVTNKGEIDNEKLEILKKKLDKSDEESAVDYSKLSFKEKDVKESANLDKYNLDGRVNPKEIQRYRTHVSYNGKSFQRIGYDKNGKELPEEVQKEQIKNLVANIKSKQDEWTVTYKAPNEKYSIVAFTDPTCPVCRKFHNTIEELNKNGVTVHYLFYPRTMQLGLENKKLKSTIAMMDSIWYSDNKTQAMDDVYSGYRPRGEEVQQTIKNPVFEHYLVGEFVGVEGTPTILMDNGNKLTGFGQVKGLLRLLVD